MFFTSFLPLWITVLFINTKSIFENKVYLYTEYISITCIILGLITSITIILKSIKDISNSNFVEYKVIEATQEKGITSEFLLSYVLPLFVFDFTKWDGVIQFIIYFGILAFLCIRNNNVYVNILFEFKKYKFYTCNLKLSSESSINPIQVIAISNKNLCAYKGNTIEIAPLNKPFYLVK